jgi:hypothetical protein
MISGPALPDPRHAYICTKQAGSGVPYSGVQHQDSGDRLGVVQAEQSKLETSSAYTCPEVLFSSKDQHTIWNFHV